MIQAKLIELFFKAFFKHPKVRGLFRYKDEPNELDLAVEELQKFRKEDKTKLIAALDLFKSSTEMVDKLSDKIRAIDSAIDLKEFEDMKDTIKIVKNMKKFKSLNAKK